jgi:hypothetical protein
MGESVMGPTETLELMAPFLTREVVNELCSGRKYADYRARKLELLRKRIARAWWRQRQLARREQGKETRFVDGIGQRKATGDEELVAFTRAKYGRHAFHDPDHLNYILREHPEFRVPVPKPRYLVVNGFRDSPSSARTCGAGDGARANPATAVGGACRQTGAAHPLGSAHEIPAPASLRSCVAGRAAPAGPGETCL